MQTLTSILSGPLYIGSINRNTREIEIEVSNYLLTGDIEMKFEIDRAEPSIGIMKDQYRAIEQTIYPETFLNEDGEEIQLSQCDKDLINAWFQQIELEIES